MIAAARAKQAADLAASFDATLRFEKAGPLQVKFQVGGIGAASAPKN